ncbi:MAG: SH3 domain-containing protein [Oscillospiraceae bacterium]
MSDIYSARRTGLQVTIGGVNVSDDINRYLLSLTYTDNEDGETDDLQIKLDDTGDVWLCKWLDKAIASVSAALPEGAGSIGQYKVSAKAGLNVRSGAGASYKKLGALSYGTAISVSEISNGWAVTVYSGKKGYVSARYITAVAGGAKSTGTPASGDVKGTSLQAVITRVNWNSDGASTSLDTGRFSLDGVSADGPPSCILIKGTSLPYDSTVRQTQKSRAWEKRKLSEIAAKIANENGMGFLFSSATDITYGRAEQVATSDIAFLHGLCSKAGLSLKVTSNAIVIFDAAGYEKKAVVKTIQRGDKSYTGWHLSTGQCDTQYTACRVSYMNPATGKVISGSYNPGGKSDGQSLELSAKVASIAQAQEMAKKMLRGKNKFERMASFDLPGDTGLVAGVTIQLTGWGAWDGKYIVKQARHSVSKSGYTVGVTLRHVLEGY